MRPWHFGDLFFQETQGSGAAALDQLFGDRDPIELARTYYASLGMEVDDILARSDLYEKPGKDSTPLPSSTSITPSAPTWTGPVTSASCAT